MVITEAIFWLCQNSQSTDEQGSSSVDDAPFLAVEGIPSICKKIAESGYSCYTGDMNDTRKLPIGVQSFEKLRNDDFFYVDKTEYLFRLAWNGRAYFLSRPRRFGKSLLLSTLKAYFLGQKKLFQGLAVEQFENAETGKREIWQQYPVCYFDFNAGIYTDEQALISRITSFFEEPEKQYDIVPADTIPIRFEQIIRRAYEKTGKQVVVLVDEYDKPLLETRKMLCRITGPICETRCRFCFSPDI